MLRANAKVYRIYTGERAECVERPHLDFAVIFLVNQRARGVFLFS